MIARIFDTDDKLLCKKICILLFFLVVQASVIRAQDHTIERIGDVGAFLLPAVGIVPSFIEGADDGYRDFARSGLAYTSTVAATYALKFSVNRTRPNGGAYSFPSGHTSSAFSGATLIQLKYGYKYGVPAYILAGFVGYSRVYTGHHYWSDVIAGAVLGTGLTYLVYRRWTRNWELKPHVDSHSYGLDFEYIF